MLKSYSMLCFFLSLAMILCPLCAVENVNNVFSNANAENTESDDVVENIDVSTVKVMSVNSKNITGRKILVLNSNKNINAL